VALKIGNLIRWVASHKSYEANGDVLVGLEPIYKYGIVMKISKKSSNQIVVASCEDARWHIIDTEYDSYEVLSEGAQDG
jgi:imidazole glycerol phosphate synthase subunit HisF